MKVFALFPALAIFTLALAPASPSGAAAARPEAHSALGSTPLTLACPPQVVKVPWGGPTDPSVTGSPTASGGCPPYTISHSDAFTYHCTAGRFVYTITRTFTAVDACGSVVICKHDIHVLKTVVDLDMHPRSCPNPLNRKGNQNGVVPGAVLGSATFDVTAIVPGTMQLWLIDCANGPVIPIPTMFHYEDVAAPYTGTTGCGCTTDGPDGFIDLTFKVRQRDLIQGLGLTSYPPFTYLPVIITGQLNDGCEFVGFDCMRVQ